MSRQPMPAERALALFDSLPAVAVAELHGFWSGDGFPTGHPLDGLLEACGWLGKRFDGPEHVQPLVFRTALGPLALRPLGMRLAVSLVLRFPVLRSRGAALLARFVLPLLATRRSQARLRQVEHRGVATATIVYDTVPVQDALRWLDADTLLGLMDLKGLPRPLFFLLRRERP